MFGWCAFYYFSKGEVFISPISPPAPFESEPVFLWNTLDSSRSQVAGYVCSAFIGRCGLKKLKRTLLLFLGFIFSLELLHARCLFPRLETKKKEKGKKKNLNAITHLKVKTNSQKTPRIISQIRYKSSGGENSELQAFLLEGGCQNSCLVGSDFTL